MQLGSFEVILLPGTSQLEVQVWVYVLKEIVELSFQGNVIGGLYETECDEN